MIKILIKMVEMNSSHAKLNLLHVNTRIFEDNAQVRARIIRTNQEWEEVLEPNQFLQVFLSPALI